MSEPLRISSRDNPLLVRLRRLAQDGAAYRRMGQVWIEGEHLCVALRERGGEYARNPGSCQNERGEKRTDDHERERRGG
jgi:hypothetical protein